jgi:hypothetical protein
MRQNRYFRLFNLCVLLLFAVNVTLHAQQRTITGTVTFAEDGSSLPGVNVMVVGTQSGTTTNVDGNYSLQIPEDAEQLRFSYIGMSPHKHVAFQQIPMCLMW